MASERPPITSHRRVTYLACRTDAREHELTTQRGIAERLAALLGCSSREGTSPTSRPDDLGYVVPNDTITSLETAARSASAAKTTCSAASCRSRSSPPRPSRIRWSTRRPRRPPAGVRLSRARRATSCCRAIPRSRSSDARAAGRRLLRDGAGAHQAGPRHRRRGPVGRARRGAARRAPRRDRRRRAGSPRASSSSATSSDVRTYSVGRAPGRDRCGPATSAPSASRATGTARRSTAARRSTVVRGGFDALERAAARRRQRGARSRWRTGLSRGGAGLLRRHVRVALQLRRRRRAATRAAGWQSACSSSRGASAARAAPRWRRSRRCATTRRCRWCAPRPSRCTGRDVRGARRARRCTSPASTTHVGPHHQVRAGASRCRRVNRRSTSAVGSGPIDGHAGHARHR